MKKIGFIGAGNMATALVGGLLAKDWTKADIGLSDRSEEVLANHAGKGLFTTTDNTELIQWADVLVLAVKPQVMAQVLKPLAELAQKRQPLIISIAAGIPVASIEHWLGGKLPVVRAMPNTPALVQTGAAGLFASPHVSVDQRQLAEDILAAVGMAVWVKEESLIDAVTAVSGSGPAYFFYLMEAMIAAGTALGLDEATSRELTLQTALGAARMAQSSDFPPAELRRRVTSPGGTTERAITVLNEGKVGDTMALALKACAARGVELADQLGRIDE